MKVRFVGGSMHNRLVEVTDGLQYCKVLPWPEGASRPLSLTFEEYRLHHYSSEHGTIYSQFVATEVAPCESRVYSESFDCSRFDWQFDDFLRGLLRACDH